MEFLHEVTSKLIGRPYKLGRGPSSEEKGLDCLGLVLEYIGRRYDFYPSPVMDGLCADTYASKFKHVPGYVMEIFVKWIKATFHKVLLKELNAGDILITECTSFREKVKGSSLKTIGIYGGKNDFLVATELFGVTFLPLDKYSIEGVYRCQQQSL